jgi:hypothetical protein
LTTADDIKHVLQVPSLSVLDLQSNRINDPSIVDILSRMPNLKVLYLQGNDVVKEIKHYRKTIIYRCPLLKYLDDRPVFDDERRRVNVWGRVLDETNGDFNAAQEAERLEMQKIRDEKKQKDEDNFRHFEQLMAEGRRKRAEELAAKASSNENPEQPEINPFSGEKIIPSKDCDLVQNAREERWASVVNEPDTNTSLPPPPTTAQLATARVTSVDPSNSIVPPPAPPVSHSTNPFEVDQKRLELLHQCATVGTANPQGRDAFVDKFFHVSSNDNASPSSSSSSLPPLEGLSIKKNEPEQHFSLEEPPKIEILSESTPVLQPPPAPSLGDNHTNVDALD